MSALIYLVLKIWKIKVRHPVLTLIELLIPIIFVYLLVLLHNNATVIDNNQYKKGFRGYNAHDIPVNNWTANKEKVLYYTPKSEFVDTVMIEVASIYDASSIGFIDEDVMVSEYLQSSNSYAITGIVFYEYIKENITYMDYEIRPEIFPTQDWSIQSLYLPIPSPGPSLVDSDYGSNYVSSGCLALQHAIAMSLIQKWVPNLNNSLDDTFKFRMKRFSYPIFSYNTFYLYPEYFSVLTLCICFIYPFSQTAKYIVAEKEKRLKEVLEIMGIGELMNWLAWYISSLAYFCLISGLITFMLQFGFSGKPAILHYSDSCVVLLWLFLYSSSLVSYCCFVSSIFDSDKAAFGGAFISFLITCVPYFHLYLTSSGDLHFIVKLFFSLFPNTMMGYSLRIFMISEVLDVGLDWTNIRTAAENTLKFSMTTSFFIFVSQTVFYSALSWYIGKVFPGRFGNPLPWYFLFTKTYWFGLLSNESGRVESCGIQDIRPEYFERDPYGVLPMIEFKHLTKIFGRNEIASVKKICLKAYKGRITVLLGHVGSGKTTAVSLLLGRHTPTSGQAFIKSRNTSVTKEARTIHQVLGYCPSYDIHINELTVMENLSFFCRVKGNENNMIKPQVEYILYVLGLDSEAKSYARDLSPTVKRKLSVGIALIGESQVVILENPTHNMDADDRKTVWEALKIQKEHRAIFVTTRHMRDAVAIADKIAVIDEGEIQCCGSPKFLREKYGSGYHLSLKKGDTCNADDVSKLILSHIPEAKKYEKEKTLKYILPSNKINLYPALFSDIEENKERLKITSLHLSEEKLYEMFDKVSLKATASLFNDEYRNENDSTVESPEESQRLLNFKGRNKGFTLLWQQVKSMFRKHYLFGNHHFCLTFSQGFLIFLVFMTINVLPDKLLIYDGVMSMDLKAYEDADVALHVPIGIAFFDENSIALSKIYESLVTEPHNFTILETGEESLEDHVVERAEEDLFRYNEVNVFGVDILSNDNITTITSFYSAKAVHSAPLSLLLTHNTVLKHLLNDSGEYFLKVSYHPWPLKMEKYLVSWHSYTDNSPRTDMLLLDISVGIAHLMASFIIFLFKEKSSNFKQLQLMNGLSPFLYWFLNFVNDFALYTISGALFIGSLAYSETEVHHILGYFASLLLVTGISGILFVYCCSFIFKSLHTAYVFVFIFNVIGYIKTVAVYLVEFNGYSRTAETLDIVFSMLSPSYCLIKGFFSLFRNLKSHMICNLHDINYDTKLMCERKEVYVNVKGVCCKVYCGSHCFKWQRNFLSATKPGIGRQFYFPFVQTLFFVLALVCFEMKLATRAYLKLIRCLEKRGRKENPPVLIADVRKENERFLSTPLRTLLETHPLVVQKVTKYFGKKLAIQNFTFGVREGECFGLIGPDESGKKTTVAMITGSTPMFSGKVYVNRKRIDFNSLKVFQNVGICPYSGGLIDHMTGEETLELCANLNGIPSQKIPFIISHLSSTLAFSHVLKEKIEQYDICFKKKLSVAIALIGYNPLIILEEPTADLDPTTCRHIWNTLLQASSLGCTILLTSNRIDECEAVCGRIGLIVKGKMVYIGDLDALRGSFGDGYTVAMHLPQARVARRAVMKRMEIPKMLFESECPEAVLKVDQSLWVHYFIPQDQVRWSKVFRSLEKIRNEVEGFSYSVTETKLEHIYLHKTIEKEKED